MNFKPGLWQPIALILGVINLVAVGAAAGAAEPWHAAIHAALAVASGWWAQRLGQGTGADDRQAGLDALEFEVGKLRQELGETQERLDFVERVLAQSAEARRVGPER